MKLRPYQKQYINNIEINQQNLIISPMRSGKSFMMERIIDTYFKTKKVLIIVGRRNIILQLSTYYNKHTFILAGKQHDSNSLVHLATFQTLQRRNIELNQYAAIFIDEVHERYNTPISKQIRSLSNITIIGFTGTPLKPNGRFLDSSIPNVLEFINIKQMIEQQYLAPTKFISRFNVFEYESELGTKNGEYIEADIERVLDKNAVLQTLVEDNNTYKWDTEHKTIIYVNSIKIAEKLYNMFNDKTHIRIMHSKLNKQHYEDTVEWFEKAKNGLVLNVRQLTVGVDAPSVDTILYLTPTKILSLFLQSVWRASTLNPNNHNKIATVYDYSGNLHKMSPYFCDWKKKKPSCKDECDKIKDLMQRYFCKESCVSDTVMIACTGKPSKSYENNPYASNFRVLQGEPCEEMHPVYEYQYKMKEQSVGKITKYSKCPCGCITAYDLQTLVDPNEMIQMYSEEVHNNTVIVLYNKQWNKAIAILDNPNVPTYSYKMFNSSEKLYKHCVKYFKSKPFQILSNVKMTKLSTNVLVNPTLNNYVNLINWETEQNQNIIRKIIKVKMEEIVDYFVIKKGYVYYQMKKINKQNEKEVLNYLNNGTIDRQKFIKFFNDLPKI